MEEASSFPLSSKSSSVVTEVINDFLFGGIGSDIQKRRQSDNSDEEEKALTSRGGWELGSYLFIGNALQVAGLLTVPADQAGESNWNAPFRIR